LAANWLSVKEIDRMAGELYWWK